MRSIITNVPPQKENLKTTIRARERAQYTFILDVVTPITCPNRCGYVCSDVTNMCLYVGENH